MILVLTALCSFCASFLTLFSGFGLGTLLMPVIALFFPVPIAISVTAVVHLADNLFKMWLLRQHVHWSTTVRFGVPAIAAAFIGAWSLVHLSEIAPLFTGHVLGYQVSIELVKIVAGGVLITFATIEWFGTATRILLNEQWLFVGGAISGFFGGLSGHQGAFRVPFLLHIDLGKKEFIATNAAIAVLIDFTRLTVYSATLYHLIEHQIHVPVLIVTIGASLAGVALGMVWLKKITYAFIQRFVALLLYLLGVGLICGII